MRDAFAALAALLPDPLLLVSPEGTILAASAAAAGRLGTQPGALDGRPLASIARNAAQIERLLAACARTTAPITGALVIADGERERRVPCEGARVPVEGGHALLLRLWRTEDSDRFGLLTREVERLNHEVLERRRAQAERDALIEQLTRALRLADMFAAVLGHDLRSPLNAALNSARLALRRADDQGVRGHLERIVSSTERMSRMIDHLLDATRIRLDRFRVSPSPLDLGELLRQVVEEVAHAHGRRDIAMRASGDPAGEWDRDRLAQLVANLVTNACEHGTPGVPIRVELDGRAPDRVVVSVANEGAPIPPEALPRLFEAFQQGGGSRGLGLGLFIARAIATAHGGTLGAESSGGRTVFTLSLPRRAATAAAAAEGPAPREADVLS